VRGFLTDPQVLFLDEPTLGLDVAAARDVRKFILQWMKEDQTRTLLLTTHYMVEADELCDRVAIINKGKVLACDTPSRLKQSLQHEAIFRIRLDCPTSLGVDFFSVIPGVKKTSIKRTNGEATLDLVLEEDAALAGVFAALTSQQGKVLSLEKREPSLEDVFMELTGLRMEEVEDADATED
jgi:ABC-2 type transport system ATP-binding protein